MDAGERLQADYAGTGLTIGPHPMALRRDEMALRGVLRAVDLPQARDGRRVRVAGMVITRQRPGTAKGFVFLTLEDESGISNIIVRPDLFDRERMTVVRPAISARRRGAAAPGRCAVGQGRARAGDRRDRVRRRARLLLRIPFHDLQAGPDRGQPHSCSAPKAPSREWRLRRERGGPVRGHPRRGHETAGVGLVPSENRFVEGEFLDFLRCGSLAGVFARLRCVARDSSYWNKSRNERDVK